MIPDPPFKIKPRNPEIEEKIKRKRAAQKD
jgi:hypothetical protein